MYFLARWCGALALAVSCYGNVIYSTPGPDSSGSMPLGNGDIGINLWVEPSGDILFYISKTDAWDENGRLLKLARVRIGVNPKTMKPGRFHQELRVERGDMTLQIGDVQWRVWVDANRPVVRLQATSSKPVVISPFVEVWRKQRRTLTGQEASSAYGLEGGPEPIVEEPDTVVPSPFGRLVWYHRNARSVVPMSLRHQGLGTLVGKFPDPLMNRTFGGAVTWGSNIVSVHVLTAQSPTAQGWLQQLDRQVEQTDSTGIEQAYGEHGKWWAAFWNRSWIKVAGPGAAATINQGYALQRFMNAAGGRGAYPIKFNGSIFTVDAKEKEGTFNADYRRWGGPYWFQNTRLPYWAMLAAGDFDLMQPLFKMYSDALMLARVRTKAYFNHDGAFFPETMTFWGTYADSNYGWNREGQKPGWVENTYIRNYYTGGLELAAMMHDYWQYTGDDQFRDKTMMPLARDVVRFYDHHFLLNDDGVLRIEPAQALETYQKAVNPMPDVAGLHWVIAKLRDQGFKEFRGQLPPLPIGPEGRLMAAEQVLEGPKNSENPELYAVFPFRLIGVGKPSLELGQKTFYTRRVKDDVGGWRQDGIQAAYLGIAQTAAEYVQRNFGKKDPGQRFPAFWGPNFDWTPDQSHGGATMIALQRMVMQADDQKIYVLPAWPRDWDVDFKLNAPGGVTVRGVWKKGRMQELDVTPKTARRMVVLPGEE